MTAAQDRPSQPRRRRRPRRSGGEPGGEPGGQPGPAGQTGAATGTGQGPPAAGSEPGPDGRPNAGRREDSGRGHGRDSERGWRELAGSSPSQVGLGGALRARDVARPTAEDLAAAERTVVVVRRQWQPPEG